jgi:hypothetical protein
MFRSITNRSLKALANHAIATLYAAVRKPVKGVVELAAPVRVEETPIAQEAADHAALRRNCRTND